MAGLWVLVYITWRDIIVHAVHVVFCNIYKFSEERLGFSQAIHKHSSSNHSCNFKFFYDVLLYVICNLILLCYLSSTICTLLTGILTVVMAQNFTITNNKPKNCSWPWSCTSSMHFTMLQRFPVLPLSSPSSSLLSWSSSSSCFTD